MHPTVSVPISRSDAGTPGLQGGSARLGSENMAGPRNVSVRAWVYPESGGGVNPNAAARSWLGVPVPGLTPWAIVAGPVGANSRSSPQRG